MWEYNETVQVNELYHHGILGMHWGIRRFQQKDGSLTKAGEKRYGSHKGKVGFMKRTDNQDRVEKKAAKIKKKRLSEEARRAAQAKKDAIANEKKRQELMKSTDPNEILKNQHLFTTQELNDIANRLQTQQRIAALSPKTISEGEQRINNVRQFANKMSAYSEAINNGQKAYNSFAEVMGLPLLGKSHKMTTKQKADAINDKLALAEARDKMRYLRAHDSLRGYEDFKSKTDSELSEMKKYNDYHKTKKAYEKNKREAEKEARDKRMRGLGVRTYNDNEDAIERLGENGYSIAKGKRLKTVERNKKVKVDTSNLGYSLQKLNREEYVNLDAISRLKSNGYSTGTSNDTPRKYQVVKRRK